MKMQWKIGNVEIPNPFVLAPMAGVTDLAFRRGADGDQSRGASGIHAAFWQ